MRDQPPHRIWHVIQFYTVGELVRDAIADEQPDYIPYADKKGLYHGEWKRYRSLIKSYWLPYLDGRVAMETAIENIAAALSGQ